MYTYTYSSYTHIYIYMYLYFRHNPHHGCILHIYLPQHPVPSQVANDAEALMLQFAVTDADASQGTPAMATIAMENGQSFEPDDIPS